LFVVDGPTTRLDAATEGLVSIAATTMRARVVIKSMPCAEARHAGASEGAFEIGCPQPGRPVDGAGPVGLRRFAQGAECRPAAYRHELNPTLPPGCPIASWRGPRPRPVCLAGGDDEHSVFE